MTVYDIGEYRVQQLNQGWKVSWDTGSIRNHLMLDIPALIAEYIEGHLSKLTRVLRLFDNGPDQLLDDDIGFQVIYAIPDSDTIPGKHIPEHEIREWHHRQLVAGYNRSFGTEFTYEMIRNRL